MKFNRLGAFTLGVVITAVSVGAVSFVNAAGDKTLKACANKTTGAMRYISKGSCKKTETSLSWNQMGPQGIRGADGSNGTNGAEGAKGDTGVAGTNGQNQWAVDANGTTLGPIRSVSSQGCDSSCIVVEIGGRLWALSLTSKQIWSNGAGRIFYTDAACKNPVAKFNNSHDPNPQLITLDNGGYYGEWDSFSDASKAYVTKGVGFSFSSREIWTLALDGSCLALTNLQKTNWDLESRLFTLTEISKPTYTAPLTIVAK